MDAGDEHKRPDAPPLIYLDTQGRYLDAQGRPELRQRETRAYRAIDVQFEFRRPPGRNARLEGLIAHRDTDQSTPSKLRTTLVRARIREAS